MLLGCPLGTFLCGNRGWGISNGTSEEPREGENLWRNGSHNRKKMLGMEPDKTGSLAKKKKHTPEGEKRED